MTASRAERDRKPAYWAVIPATVRYDPDLPANAKLMYGEIQALATAEGYCWATNEYFSQLYGLSIRTVRGLVSKLASKDHILVEVLRDPNTNEVLERRIWVDKRPQPDTPLPEDSGDENGTPQEEICLTPQEEICRTPQEEICRKNNINIFNNNPPIIPPQGAEGEKPQKPKKKKRKEPKAAPDWKPERFQAFWEAYPCGDGKQAAITAWDKLQPDEALLKEMALGLMRQLQREDWQRGVAIPHASTWLNQRRWEDTGIKPIKAPTQASVATEEEVPVW